MMSRWNHRQKVIVIVGTPTHLIESADWPAIALVCFDRRKESRRPDPGLRRATTVRVDNPANLS